MLGVDRRTATYFPTARFAELGAWIADGSIYPQDLLDLLKALCADTGETVTLAVCNDLEIEIVRVERSGQAISFTAERGQKLPLWGSGAGTAYLSTLDAAQIRALYRRAQDRKLLGADAPTLESALAGADLARRSGYAVAEGAVFKDASAIAVATPFAVNLRPLIVSIAGPTSRMKPRFAEHGLRARAALDELAAKRADPGPEGLRRAL